jgi:hypothetical protein
MATQPWRARTARGWHERGDARRTCRTSATTSGTLIRALVAISLLTLGERLVYAGELETEHLFGFTLGSTIGEKGEKEIEGETTARTGKGSGTYAAIAQEFEAKYTIESWFRISPAAVFAYHDVSGVPDFVDRRQASFQGLSLDNRFLMVDRNRAPFGLMVSVEPHWNRVDDLTGERVENYGGTFLLAVDKELVAQKLFGAANIFYEPEVTHVVAWDQWARQSLFGISGAIAGQVNDAVFVGAEIRSLHLYDGLGFNRFAGWALFAGPTLYAKLSEHAWLSFAWNVQLRGFSAEQPSVLDLANFERHQIKLRLGYHF